MKRILIFSNAYYPHVGGAEVAIKEITDRIQSSEIEFHMVTNRFDSTLPKVERVGNVLVHRIGIATKKPAMADLRRFPLHLNKLLYQYGAYHAARKLHREYRYDAVWAMMAHTAGIPAALFKRAFPDVPYLLTLQEGDPPKCIEKKMRMFGPWFSRAFTTADMLQSISIFLDRWGRRMGFRGAAHVIPNGVDATRFAHVRDEDIEEARRTLGKKDGEVFLVTTSRLVGKNAVDVIIHALALLPKRIRLIVFGDGPDETMLRTLAQTLGVEGRVDFRGHIDRNALPAHLSACDIFVRPSRSEGMGISFIEAMAAKLPVVATDVGGISDFLVDARRKSDTGTGWVVGVDSPEDIREAVNDILSNRAHVLAVTERARTMVKERYDWDTITENMKKLVFEPLFEVSTVTKK